MSKYIIYLHPRENSVAYEQLANFWRSNIDIKPNDARNYPFHATLVSFFETTEPEKILKSAKNIFKDNNFNFNVKVSEIVREKSVKYISISSEEIDEFIKKITSDTHLKSRVIGALHITLAHNTQKKDDTKLENLISNSINIDEWSPKEWTIVMWECLPSGEFKIYDIII